MKVYNFEELTIWKMARDLVKDVYALCAPQRDYGFTSQLQRATVSIMNNIAEGFERSKNAQDNKLLLNFLNISYGSCGEVRSMMYAAEDLGYIDAESAKTIRNSCTALAFKIEAWMTKLREYDNTTKQQQRS